ncbi:MAG TPA: ATP-binding protein [Syntrophobacteria bacterium]|nr:ATP-binding protein [Syntrophobacteria bacterium]
MRIGSIRARLTLWYTGLLTVSLLILGGAAYGLLVYSLGHELDVSLQGVAQTLSRQSHGGTTRVIPSEIDDLFRHFFGFSPWDRYFDLLDPSGHPDPQQPFTPSERLPLSSQALRNASRRLATFETVEGLGPYPVRVLTLPVVEGGRVVRLIQVGMPLGSIYLTRTRFLLVLGVVLPVGLLLAGGGGWLLARRALRPVERMREAAHRISAEHLAERLEETGAGDELDRLAKTLNEMLGRLDEGLNQIRRFSADASHELQTPLTILRGELEVALRSPRSPGDYQQVLQSALEEIDRIASLTEGLLLLARADAGVLRMDRQPLDLADLVADLYGRVKVLADSRSIRLVLGPVEPVSIRGDYERLRRLLLNLLDNGVKYTDPGGRVTLSLQRQSEWAALRVSDTGIGLSPEKRERIFQPFYRAAKAHGRDEDGHGLGLAIARSIAEAHGGSIQVESARGRGSTFTVLLPKDS